jgi:hypothetical protein
VWFTGTRPVALDPSYVASGAFNNINVNTLNIYLLCFNNTIGHPSYPSKIVPLVTRKRHNVMYFLGVISKQLIEDL